MNDEGIDDFYVVLAGMVDEEDLIAEVAYRHEEVAVLRRVDGGQVISVYGKPNGEPHVMPLADFQHALQQASDQLGEAR